MDGDGPRRRERPSPRTLRRFGLADVFGAVSALTGALAATLGVVCCVGPIRDAEVALFMLALVATTLWSGAFGVVLRGSAQGHNSAVLGLILGLFAVLEGAMGFAVQVAR